MCTVAAVGARGYNCDMRLAGFPSSSRTQAWLFALILVALTVFAYQPAWHGGFLWDDDLYVTKNPLLTAPDGLQRIWFSLDSPSQYFPLTYTTFRIEHAIWGLNPIGYHWINLMLHASNALLLWWLLTRLKIPWAWLAAGIFALHPVQVESVAWITERKNVLMGFFFILTLIQWTQFLDAPPDRRGRYYFLALLTYLLALSAKATACTLPAALFLILWLQDKRIDRKRILQMLPFLMLGLAMGLVAVWWEHYHQGTREDVHPLSLLERILVASHAPWFYLGKIFWPANLTFIYPRWAIAPGNPLAYGWLAAGIGAGIAIYLARRHVGRGPEVAALFFVATLSPVIGFIMLYTFRYTFVADHYQYLACIGPIALVSAGAARVFERWRAESYFALVGLSTLAALSALSWNQSKMYRDIETLWRTTLEQNPACWMAENNLGIALVEKGETGAAIDHYEKAIRLYPNFAETHYNYANALLQDGRTDEAINEARQSLVLQPNDPDAHVALGNALLAKGSADEAIENYSKAITISPGHSSAHYNLANALQQKGYLREAIAHYEKAIANKPKFMEALTNLAWILSTSSDTSLRNGPRAILLATQANEVARERTPLIERVLAAAYAQTGQFSKAVETAREASDEADRQGNAGLVEALGREIALYRSGSAYQDP